MLWSVLPWLNRDGLHRQPRKAVATAVRLLLFGVGCCIAFAVRLQSHQKEISVPIVKAFVSTFERRLRDNFYCNMICKTTFMSDSHAMMQCVQAYDVLGNVMSLVGGFASMSCSLLMPSLFYLILFWKELARGSRTGERNDVSKGCTFALGKGCEALNYVVLHHASSQA